MSSIRTPDAPRNSEFARKSMAARTSALGRRGPVEDLCCHSAILCTSINWSRVTCTSAIPPNNVVIP